MTYTQLAITTEDQAAGITQPTAKMLESGINSTIVLVKQFQRQVLEALELTFYSIKEKTDYETL